MKKHLLLIVGAVLLFATSSPALAEEVTNSHTGAESVNSASETIKNETKIEIKNDANIDTIIKAETKTGGNEAEENTGNGTVETGDTTVTAKVENDVNINKVEVDNCCKEENGQGGGPDGEQPDGKGGGVFPPVIPSAQAAAGIGGGPTLAAAETAPESVGIGGGELVEVGSNPLVQLALMLGLPLIALYLIRKYEISAGKIIA